MTAVPQIVPVPYVVATTIAVLVGLAGGLLTDTGPWHRALIKPAWQPPGYLFGPVWTVILLLGATSAALAWEATRTDSARHALVALLAINCGLNVAWSVLFFQMQRPDWALIDLIALWLSILALMIWMWSVSGAGSLLLLPYLLWVGFAGALNAAIVQLNRPA